MRYTPLQLIKIKLIIYVALELLLILMARITFGGLGKISTLLQDATINEQALPIIQNLYIYQTILIFIPFLAFLALIIKEVMNYRKLLEKLKQDQKTTEVVEETRQEEDSEEERLEKERLEKERVQKIKDRLDESLNKNLSDLPESDKQDKKIISEKILSSLAEAYEITQAEIFLRDKTQETDKMVLSASYAFYIPEEKVFEFEMGEGLIGQVAKAGKSLNLNKLPQGYITVKSGLGSATPTNLTIVPWKDSEGDVYAIIEIAAFKEFNKNDIEIFENISDKVTKHYH